MTHVLIYRDMGTSNLELDDASFVRGISQLLPLELAFGIKLGGSLCILQSGPHSTM